MQKTTVVKIVWILCYVFLIVVCLNWLRREFKLSVVPNWGDVNEDIPIISTRNNFRSGRLAPFYDKYEYATLGNIPGFMPGTDPPDDLLIIIHGFNNNEGKASSACGLARDSLLSNEFDGAIIGLSWDADTQLDPTAMIGYHEGRLHAAGNGRKLSRFIVDYKAMWPDVRIHVLGYSLGTHVALEMLYALEHDRAFSDMPILVDSVHLVGASIDNELVQTDKRYGTAIENRVKYFYNFSTKDKVLGIFYRIKEGDMALGCWGIQNRDFIPRNYADVDAGPELKALDSRGNIDSGSTGDNHLGCLGLRRPTGELVDDGVMNLVAQSIRRQNE